MKYVLMAMLVSGCIFGHDSKHGNVPTSIAAALTMRPDEFPPPYTVVVPPVADSALGRSFEPGTVKNGRGQLTAKRCFYVASTAVPSLSEMRIDYKASAEVAAELDKIALNAGLKMKTDASATLVLSGLEHERSISLPNFAACTFDNGNIEKKVVTQELVATSAALDYTHAFEFDAKLEAPQLNSKLKAGWVSGETGKLEGKRILLAAKEETVKLQVETKTLSWPDNKAADLPFTPMGKITIDAYNLGASQDQAAIKLTIIASAKGTNPTDIASCKTGKEGMTMARGDSCLLVFDGDNAGAFITWAEAGDGKAAVTVRGFRSL